MLTNQTHAHLNRPRPWHPPHPPKPVSQAETPYSETNRALLIHVRAPWLEAVTSFQITDSRQIFYFE